MSGSVKVSFQLFGVDLDPEEVTRATGLVPSKTWRTGDAIGGSIRRYEKSGWRLDAEDGAAEVEAQVDSVLSRTAALEPFLGRYASELSLVVRAGEVDGGLPAVHFTPDQLRQIAALGCSIDIDIYG